MSDQPPEDGQADGSSSNDGFAIDRRNAMKGGAVGLAAVGLGALGTGIVGAESADKIFTTGSTMKKLAAQQKKNGSTNTGPATLLEGDVKLSTPTDLLIYTTAETSLFTKVKDKGNDKDAARATAGVYAWIEIDGIPVPVSTSGWDGDSTVNEDERVVLDRREFSLDYYNVESDDTLDDNEITAYIDTRSASGFNWFALNVDRNFPAGDGTHHVAFRGQVELELADNEDGEAAALVGDRTMFVQPVKLPTGETY